MRWHVELADTNGSLHVEHVDDEEIALSTARELVATAHGGHRGVPAEEIERVVGELADDDLADVEPGEDRNYEFADGMIVIVAGLDDADTDDDCWRCAADVEAKRA